MIYYVLGFGRRLPHRVRWACIFLLMLAGHAGWAQITGDYRTATGGAPNFRNQNSWELWNGSTWVTNTGPLDYSKTFFVRHAKTIPAAGVAPTIGRIVLETDNVEGTSGVLTINGPMTCTKLLVSGAGTQVLVKDDAAIIGSTSILNQGTVALMSSGQLGNVAIGGSGTLTLTTGVGNTTAVGPVTISNGGLLSVAASGPTVSELTVQAGGQALINAQTKLVQCRIEAGGVLVQQAGGQIQVIHDAASGTADLLMQGQLRNESNTASVALAAGAQMEVQAGAVYTHTANGGGLPTGTWDPASTLEIKGIVDASGFTNDGQIFGNVVWDTPDYGTSGGGSNVFYLNNSGSMRIAGKLTVRNTGLGRLQLTPNTGSGPVLTQIQDYEQVGGQVCVARFGSALTRTLQVSGNFTLGSGRFELSNSSSSGPGVLKVDGAMQLNGGTLLLSGGAASGTVHLGGNLTLNDGSDLRRDVTGGIATVNFVGSQPQYFSRTSGAVITGMVDLAVASGSVLDVGTSIVTGDGDFGLPVGATLRTSHNQGIAAKSPANTAYTGSVQVTGTRSFSAGATYVYNGSSAQQTGNGLPASMAAAGELAIDNSSGVVTLSRATTLAGTLRLRQGRLLTSTNLLTLLPTATWTEASNASYVDGPLARQTNSNTQVYTFPVGTDGRLKVAGVRASATGSHTFRLLAYTTAAPNYASLASSSNLYSVSQREYWEVTRTAGTAGAFMRLYYTVPYSAVQETPAAQDALRIAALTNGQWASYGRAALPNVTERYLDAAQALALTTGTGMPVTFGTTSAINPLPITLVEFRAKLVGKDVQLTWRTAQEINNAGFEVQVSDNNADYRILDYYHGAGTSSSPVNYAHLDADAFRNGQKVRYYRLRQLDTDGKFSFSGVVAVAAGAAAEPAVVAWPVPATDWLNIRLGAVNQGKTLLRIMDARGRLCQTIRYEAADLPDVVRLPVAQLHRGLYFVQVETEQSRVQVRFLKE